MNAKGCAVAVFVVIAVFSVASEGEWKSDREPGASVIWTSAAPDAEFGIKCRRGRLSMDINRGHVQGLIRRRPEAREYAARVAFDGGSSRRLHLREHPGSPLGDSWMFADVDDEELGALIRDLRTHQRMIVTLANRGERETTILEFDIRGFSKAFAPLGNCRIPKMEGRR
jgi:hypothetical protein